jgi:predicted amidohydrolase
MTPDTLRLDLVQRKHTRYDIEGNLGKIKESLERSESDLVIFPEMFLTGYSLGDDVHKMAIDPGSELFSEVQEICREHDRHLIFGFPERSSEIKGQVHNSACIIGPDGIRGIYRKMHLVDFGPFEEWAYYTPGRDLVMFQMNGFNIGVIICYDIFFPELTKIYALNGADLVVCISASPSTTRVFFEKVMTARAIENTIYFAYSNLVGFDSRMDFWGGGALIGPRGETVSKGPYFEEATVSCQMDRHSLELSRKYRPTLRDTRPSLLNELSGYGKINRG